MPRSTIGAALRAHRQRKRLSLAEVAERSGYEFKASSLGAYERGDRAISVRRLQRLSELYGVRVDALMRDEDLGEIDLRELAPNPSNALILDLGRVLESHSPGAAAVVRFATTIRTLRRQPASSILAVRKTDAAFLAALMGCSESELRRQLSDGGVLTSIP
jgi:transcriptional regulator with XRE-family HTH domain